MALLTDPLPLLMTMSNYPITNLTELSAMLWELIDQLQRNLPPWGLPSMVRWQVFDANFEEGCNSQRSYPFDASLNIPKA